MRILMLLIVFLGLPPYGKEVSLAENASSMKYLRIFQFLPSSFYGFFWLENFLNRIVFPVFFIVAVATTIRILIFSLVFLSAVSFINKVLHAADAFSIKYFCCFHLSLASLFDQVFNSKKHFYSKWGRFCNYVLWWIFERENGTEVWKVLERDGKKRRDCYKPNVKNIPEQLPSPTSVFPYFALIFREYWRFWWEIAISCD